MTATHQTAAVSPAAATVTATADAVHTEDLTIIVPVYSGIDEVQRCLDSVARHAELPGQTIGILIIEDASPDAEMIDLVTAFAAACRLPAAVLHNRENLGFVRTVNRGLRATTGDVIILNADTVVTDGWLTRMVEAVGPGVGTVTPLTNFGSICTMPATVSQAFDLHTDAPRIDDCGRFVTANSVARRPEVICGVGFCMLVTRDLLDTCGLLDEAAFGRGYGEEVDLCLRATKAGFTHVVDDTTFVFHQGGVSFGGERAVRMAEASLLIHERYPSFRITNRRERLDDPLRISFAALELGLAERDPSRPHVLQLLHGSPESLGGTEKHLAMLVGALHGEFDFSTLYPTDDGFVVRTMWQGSGSRPVTHELLLPAGPRGAGHVIDAVAAVSLATAIDLLQPDAVHIQNLVRHSLAPLDALADFPGPVICSVRDFLLACPNHSVLYRNELACGLPEDLTACATCLPETAKQPVERLVEHRQAVADRLDTVDHWVFASRSAADQFLRVYDLPEPRIDVVPHGSIVTDAHDRPDLDESLIGDEPLRVAFVGRGWAKKGMVQVNDLARQLVGTSVEIHHFGGPKDAVDPAVHLHGSYDNDVLPELLWAAGIQVVLQPGPVPETFSHVLTESWAAGLPVIGTRYGAVGERIRATGGGWTVLPDDIESLVDLVRALDANRDEVLLASRRVRTIEFEPMAMSAARYATMYRREPNDLAGPMEEQS